VHAALREPVGTARWADELGNRLVLMSVRGQQQGSLTLMPEHLGPVEVQISMNRDTANVWFGAAHADTRAALAEAMPRLRELLASSGLSLGQSGVSEQAPREGFGTPGSHPGAGSTALDTDSAAVAAPAWRLWRPGLIDTYA
jgi:flagellar hook-length control protein FliK